MRTIAVCLILLASAGISFAQQSGGGGGVPGAGGGGGSSLLSQKVVYTSKLAGVTGGVAVVPGSSATSTTDSAAALNTAIASGNVDLEVDSGYALSTSLVLASNTTIHCIAPQYGFIMQTTSNATPMVNANPNAPTTTSGTGGWLVSNQTDKNITVRGCTINANSTQAVTGTQSGIAHKYNPGTGLWVLGVQFIGVNNLVFENNEVYDSGTYAFMGSNDSYMHVNNNWFHQPLPLVSGKNTAAIQVVGPDQFLWWEGNRGSCADDCYALNADDGNRTGSGDPNLSFGSWPGTKWGWITDAFLDNNTLDSSYFGIRLYSATELVDRVFIHNTSGTTCGQTGVLAALTALGSGNFGKIDIDGWTVQSDGTCNVFGFPYNFYSTANTQSLKISGVKIANPGAVWPVFTQASGTINNLSLRDWDIQTTSSTFTPCLVNLTGGTANSIAISGLNWYDTQGTIPVFCGAAAPSTLTASNYSGPNRLLGAGFTPGNSNGDAFTNTYTAITTYLSSTFNEAGSGNLAGTAPSICTNGCTGNWTQAAGTPTTPWHYTTNSATLGTFCTGSPNDGYCPVFINVGHANFVARLNLSAVTTGTGFSPVVRWTDANNFVTFQFQVGSNQWQLYDVVAGVTTLKQTATFAGGAGNYTITANGTTISLTNANGTISGTVTGSNTATTFGMADFFSSPSGSDVITSLSVKSN